MTFDSTMLLPGVDDEMIQLAQILPLKADRPTIRLDQAIEQSQECGLT